MKHITKKLISLLVALTLAAPLISSCTKENEITEMLNVACTKEIGDLSPFSSPSDIKDMIYSRLISLGTDGNIEYGEGKNCAALDVEVFKADRDFEKNDNGDLTAVDITLKNGMKFSSSDPVSADDVIFSIYAVTNDEVGHLDNDSFPLVGLMDYKSGYTGIEETVATARSAVENGFSSEFLTDEEILLLRKEINEAGKNFTEKIVDHVIENYLSDSAAASYIIDGISADDIKNSEALTVSFAMKLWNFGTFTYEYTADPEGTLVGIGNEESGYTYKTTLKKALENEFYVKFIPDENGNLIKDFVNGGYYEDDSDEIHIRYSKVLQDKYTVISKTKLTGFRDTEGTLYSLEGDDYPDISKFYEIIEHSYTDNTGVTDYRSLEMKEGANDGDAFLSDAILSYAKANTNGDECKTISGIKKDKKEINGETYENVILYFYGSDPLVAEKCTFYISRKAAFLKENKAENGIFPKDSASLSESVQKFISKTPGSGPYIVSAYSDKTVSLRANRNFKTIGKELCVPEINDVTIKYLESSNALNEFENGNIDIILSGIEKSDAEKLSDISQSYFIQSSVYRYILINPCYYLNLNTREAIASLLDISTANNISDGIPMTSNAPIFFGFENERNVVFDESLETAKEKFIAAGYKTDENGALIDPKTSSVAHFVFTLSQDDEESCVRKIFEKASELLEELGATSEIICDSDFSYNIYSENGVAIYSSVWSINSPTLSLYERYSLSSGTATVIANGINAMYIGGQTAGNGTITYNDEKLTQSDALDKLNSLISDSNYILDKASRKEKQKESLDIVNALCFEIPVIQNGTYALISKNKIDLGNIESSFSPFKSLADEISKMRFSDKAESSSEENTSDTTSSAQTEYQSQNAKEESSDNAE